MRRARTDSLTAVTVSVRDRIRDRDVTGRIALPIMRPSPSSRDITTDPLTIPLQSAARKCSVMQTADLSSPVRSSLRAQSHMMHRLSRSPR